MSTIDIRSQYTLFHISFGINSYPVTFKLHDDIKKEIPTELFRKIEDTSEIALVADDEKNFIKALSILFNTDRVKGIIKALISQTQ